MSKYIIELGEDANMVQVISVTQSGNAYIDSTVYVGYLEQLTADYINKHYGSLQDDAYQRGLEDGKAVKDKGCEGCKYQANKELTYPCSECANNHKNYWAKGEFVRGDVVVDEDGTRGIVVSSENNESNLLYVLFKGYRVPQSVVRKRYKKTGEHYDIDKFLDEIKGDGDK